MADQQRGSGAERLKRTSEKLTEIRFDLMGTGSDSFDPTLHKEYNHRFVVVTLPLGGSSTAVDDKQFHQTCELCKGLSKYKNPHSYVPMVGAADGKPSEFAVSVRSYTADKGRDPIYVRKTMTQFSEGVRVCPGLMREGKPRPFVTRDQWAELTSSSRIAAASHLIREGGVFTPLPKPPVTAAAERDQNIANSAAYIEKWFKESTGVSQLSPVLVIPIQVAELYVDKASYYLHDVWAVSATPKGDPIAKAAKHKTTLWTVLLSAKDEATIEENKRAREEGGKALEELEARERGELKPADVEILTSKAKPKADAGEED